MSRGQCLMADAEGFDQHRWRSALRSQLAVLILKKSSELSGFMKRKDKVNRFHWHSSGQENWQRYRRWWCWQLFAISHVIAVERHEWTTRRNNQMPAVTVVKSQQYKSCFGIIDLCCKISCKISFIDENINQILTTCILVHADYSCPGSTTAS